MVQTGPGGEAVKTVEKILRAAVLAALAPLPAAGQAPADSAPALKLPAAETRQSEAEANPPPPESAPSPVTPEREPVASPAPAADGVVLPAFPLSRYRPLWERSPFQLESVAPPVESAGLAQRFALTGIAEINREPIAFIMERATQKRMMVKKDAGDGGVSLVQVDVQKNYNESTVTLRQGAEVGVVRFDAAAPSAMPPTVMPQQRGLPGVPQAGVPQAGVPQPATTMAAPPAPRPPSAPAAAPGQPTPAPGVVSPVPGPGVPPEGQVQNGPGQVPPPRVIRRRALIPASP